ncbi:MAG: hypothetical protein R2879_15710 [Saprospiraceae bacterium]
MKNFLSIFFLLLFFGAFGQNKKAYQEKAETTFREMDYAASLEHYKTLIQIDSNDIDAIYHAALSADYADAYGQALLYYGKLSQAPGFAEHPEFHNALYKAGMMQKTLGLYDSAIETFNEFSASPFGSDSLKNLAIQQIAACEWAKKVRDEQADSLDFFHFGPEVNSYYADFGAMYQDGGLYYTSAYQEGVDPNDATEPTTRVYRFDEGAEKGFPIAGNPANAEMLSAHFVKDIKNNRNFITHCEQLDPMTFRCKLFYFEVNDEGTEELVAMPNYINLDSFTTTQPAVGTLNDTTFVFFASDRPGGKGGYDIYYTWQDTSGSWAQPKNFEAINTEGDDVTPFYHEPSQSIFFSSNGIKNMGGFDIYKTTYRINDWTNPIHTGYPINSSFDDLYFSYDAESAQAYLTSNRPGCMCQDAEKGCYCNDIYKYPIPVDLTVEAFNITNGEPLYGVVVELWEESPEGEILVKRIENPSGNDFFFELELDKTYRITGDYGPDWSTDSRTFSTTGIYKPTHIKQKLEFLPAIRLDVLVFDALTMDTINNFLFELQEDKRYTDLLIKRLGNLVTFNIRNGIEYDYRALKGLYNPGEGSYMVEQVYEPTIFRDSVYLTFDTVTLYFDNDHPDPDTRAVTTQVTYGGTIEGYTDWQGKTHEGYYDKKSYFIQRSIEGKSPDKQEVRKRELTVFFNDEIKQNYDRLNFYSGLLEKYLKANPNRQFQIQVDGFASPLAGPSYNKNLTQRRIMSVMNHFEQYNNGFLKPYLDNGNIKIMANPNGEQEANPNVSADPGNRSESVFSREASLERRVQISKIEMISDGLSATEVIYDATNSK